MKTKHKFQAVLLFAVLAAAAAAVLLPRGTVSCVLSGGFQNVDLFDGVRHLLLREDGTARYWIDGEENTDGCHWDLIHLECRRNGCLFRCRETEALWLLSRAGEGVRMENKVSGSTLSKNYEFRPVPGVSGAAPGK